MPILCTICGKEYPSDVHLQKHLLEKKFPTQMDSFYKFNNLTKKGQGIGGNFNGVSIKFILQESKLFELEGFLPEGSTAFITYLRSLREVHSLCEPLN